MINQVFNGIAVNSSDSYDIAELNLQENLKHSLSDNEDILSLNKTEICSYRVMLTQIYRKRSLYKCFLSEDDMFIDPLKVFSELISDLSLVSEFR